MWNGPVAKPAEQETVPEKTEEEKDKMDVDEVKEEVTDEEKEEDAANAAAEKQRKEKEGAYVTCRSPCSALNQRRFLLHLLVTPAPLLASFTLCRTANLH